MKSLLFSIVLAFGIANASFAQSIVTDATVVELLEIGRGLELFAFAGMVDSLNKENISVVLESIDTNIRPSIITIIEKINELPPKAKQKITKKAVQIDNKLSVLKEECLLELQKSQQAWNDCSGNCAEQAAYRTILSKNIIKKLIAFLVTFKKQQLVLAELIYNELLMHEELQEELSKDDTEISLHL